MHSETLSTAPILAVAHFIISDLWPGVKSADCIRPNSLQKKFNSYNGDSETKASAPYQLNLVSFDNFHYRIRLIHLLHPPLLLLGRCSVFFSARHRGHMQLSLPLSLSLRHLRLSPVRLTLAALIPAFFYHLTPPNKSELSPNWTFSLFSLRSNCPHPSVPPPFFTSLTTSPPPSPLHKCLVNKLNSNCG